MFCDIACRQPQHQVHRYARQLQGSVTALMQQPGAVFGQSDAGAHVAQLCDANMGTDLLSDWVRDRGVFTLEAAIHKLTWEPAKLFGLADRGRVREGAAADLVVFDLDTLSPGPLRRVRDLPGDEERLIADEPAGIDHIFVNGVAITRQERHASRRGERPHSVATRPAVALDTGGTRSGATMAPTRSLSNHRSPPDKMRRFSSWFGVQGATGCRSATNGAVQRRRDRSHGDTAHSSPARRSGGSCTPGWHVAVVGEGHLITVDTSQTGAA